MAESLITSDYRAFLQWEYERRLERNPAYSARAMARDLGLSPGFFNQIMRGQRRLSGARALTICRTMDWSDERTKAFLDLVQRAHESDEERALKDEVTPPPAAVDLDAFQIVAEWYHFAILELFELKDSCADPAWFARRLGIKTHEARLAIERLTRTGLLTEKEGKLVRTVQDYQAGYVPSKAVRHFHHQMMEKAMAHQNERPFDEREFAGVTLAIDPARLGEARAYIRRFYTEFLRLMQPREAKAVYQLSIQFFRLDGGDG